MSDHLSRRGFLSGIVKTTAAAGALVISASPEEIARFASGQHVSVGEITETPFGRISLGELLFNHKGEPVAVVNSINADVSTVDITHGGDQFVRLAPAGVKWMLTAVMQGPASMKFSSRY